MTDFHGAVLNVDGGESLTLDEDSDAGSFCVGGTSTGTLIIEGGAMVEMTENDGTFSIGADPGGQGFVTIRGVSLEERTTLDISRTGNPGANPLLFVGGFGTGVLNIEDHALLRTQTAFIGLHSGSSGTVNLDNAGWTAFEIKVGDSGQGTLNVLNNAALASQDTVIGNAAGSNGEATIDHAFWTVDGTFAVGRDGGVGSLEIVNGGTLTFLREGSWDFTIGVTDGAGSVLVSGAGSKLSVNKDGNFINVGPSGQAELKVTNLGTIETHTLFVGSEANSSTPVVTASAGGAILVGERVDLRGTLDVADDGSIVIGGTSKISGAVHIVGAGRLDAEGLIKGNLVNDGSVGLNGGLKITGSIAGSGDYDLNSSQLTVGSANSTSTTVSGSISGDGGSLVKTGDGTLKLSGANTFTGATQVKDGTLELAGSGTHTKSSGITVDTGSNLKGNVIFDGSVANKVVNKGAMTGEVHLGAGNDTFIGTGGSAVKVFGEDGNDTLTGGSKNDTLGGGAGTDKLVAGLGTDILTGGGDKDIFVWTSIKDSVGGSAHDTVKDFKHSQADKIDLHLIDASTKAGGDQKFSFIGDKAFTKHAGELHYVAKSGYVLVQGDVNGDGKADFEIKLDGVSKLMSDDFVL